MKTYMEILNFDENDEIYQQLWKHTLSCDALAQGLNSNYLQNLTKTGKEFP